MANNFDGDVNVDPLATVTWQDQSTSPVTNLLKVGYTAVDPNGVRSGPVGSLLSGPAGLWRNTDGATAWDLLDSVRVTADSTTVISDPIFPVDAAFHPFSVGLVPQAVTLPIGTFRPGVDGQNFQVQAGIQVSLDDNPIAAIKVLLLAGSPGFQNTIAMFQIPSIRGDIALRASVRINADGSFRASVFATATTAAGTKDTFTVLGGGGGGFDLLDDNLIGIDFAWAGVEDPADSARLVELSVQAFV